MRPTPVQLRKYLLQEFIYKKEIREGTSRCTQVIGCAQRFRMSRDIVQEWDRQRLPKPPKPIVVIVVPLFDRAMPSFWEDVRSFIVDSNADGVFVEGFSLKKHPRPKKSLAPPIMKKNPWQRWRQQRPPWPWKFPFPTRLHGGDLEYYNVFQRIFPYLRPKPDPVYDQERINNLLTKAFKINEGYDGEVVVTLYHYRFAPIIAEALEEHGYSSLRKTEFVAGTTTNEIYGKAMEQLIKNVDECWDKK